MIQCCLSDARKSSSSYDKPDTEDDGRCDNTAHYDDDDDDDHDNQLVFYALSVFYQSSLTVFAGVRCGHSNFAKMTIESS